MAQGELVAVLELDVELRLAIAGHAPAGAVVDIGERADPVQLADSLARSWTGAEPEQAEVLPHIRTPDEADFRTELIANHQAIELHAVAIAFVIELTAVAAVVAVEPWRPCFRPIGVERQVVEEPERCVGSVRIVARTAGLDHRAAGVHDADAALAQHVPPHADDGEVRLVRRRPARERLP